MSHLASWCHPFPYHYNDKYYNTVHQVSEYHKYTGRSHFMTGLCSRETSCQSNTKFPFKTVYFLGLRGLTSSYMVYDLTSERADL